MIIGIVTVVPSLVYSLDENRFSLPWFLYSTIDRRKSFSSDLIDKNETMPADPKLKFQEKQFDNHFLIAVSNLILHGFQLQSKMTTRLLPVKFIPIPPAIVETMKRRDRIFAESLNLLM